MNRLCLLCSSHPTLPYSHAPTRAQPSMADHDDATRRLLLGLGSDTPPSELARSTVALYAILCALFVMGSGLAAGLTLGLMSLDSMEMQVLLRSGNPRQQRLARTIMPVIADPHWLLVTLLLCNAACFEALPLFLDVLINPVGAILISVTLILLFGEILPQAVCARHGLAIGAAFGWPVRFMMWLTCPVSWPLARCLDWLLGKEGYTIFKRAQLKALVDLHGADEGFGGKLSDDEVQIISGALDLTNKIAFEAMTSLDKVVMLSTDQCLDRATISVILASGHSRLPVYAGNNKSNIIGLLLVKELLAYAFPGEEQTIRSHVPISALKIRRLPRVSARTRLYDLLKLFRTGRAHMVLLTQPEEGEDLEDTNPASIVLPVTGMIIQTADQEATQHPPAGDGPRRPPSDPRLRSAGMPTPSPASAIELAHPAGNGADRRPPAVPRNHVHGAVCGEPAAAPSLTSSDAQQGQAHRPPTAVDIEAQNQDTLGSTSSPGAPNTSQSAVPSSRVLGAEEASLLRTEEEGRHSVNSKLGGLSKLSARLAASWRARRSLDHNETASVSTETLSGGSEEEGEEVEVPNIALPGEPIGIITIEDVLEELMGQEILDETDHYADNEQTMPVNEELRARLAQKLPERLRDVVLGRSSLGRRLSKGSQPGLARASGGASGARSPRVHNGEQYERGTVPGHLSRSASAAGMGSSSK